MNYNPAVDAITQKDFLEVINVMADVFPNINNKSRIKFYFEAVKDLPSIALKDISKSFLMSSKQMPLPSDFINAASDWKRNNKSYGYDPDEPTPILCSLCSDLGIVRIQHHADFNFDCLMNCNCKKSITKSNKLPEWDFSLSAAYKVSTCPSEWFKPTSTSEFSKDNFEIRLIIKKWSERKYNAEKYWKEIGYIH